MKKQKDLKLIVPIEYNKYFSIYNYLEKYKNQKTVNKSLFNAKSESTLNQNVNSNKIYNISSLPLITMSNTNQRYQSNSLEGSKPITDNKLRNKFPKNIKKLNIHYLNLLRNNNFPQEKYPNSFLYESNISLSNFNKKVIKQIYEKDKNNFTKYVNNHEKLVVKILEKEILKKISKTNETKENESLSWRMSRNFENKNYDFLKNSLVVTNFKNCDQNILNNLNDIYSYPVVNNNKNYHNNNNFNYPICCKDNHPKNSVKDLIVHNVFFEWVIDNIILKYQVDSANLDDKINGRSKSKYMNVLITNEIKSISQYFINNNYNNIRNNNSAVLKLRNNNSLDSNIVKSHSNEDSVSFSFDGPKKIRSADHNIIKKKKQEIKSPEKEIMTKILNNLINNNEKNNESTVNNDEYRDVNKNSNFANKIPNISNEKYSNGKKLEKNNTIINNINNNYSAKKNMRNEIKNNYKLPGIPSSKNLLTEQKLPSVNINRNFRDKLQFSSIKTTKNSTIRKNLDNIPLKVNEPLPKKVVEYTQNESLPVSDKYLYLSHKYNKIDDRNFSGKKITKPLKFSKNKNHLSDNDQMKFILQNDIIDSKVDEDENSEKLDIIETNNNNNSYIENKNQVTSDKNNQKEKKYSKNLSYFEKNDENIIKSVDDNEKENKVVKIKIYNKEANKEKIESNKKQKLQKNSTDNYEFDVIHSKRYINLKNNNQNYKKDDKIIETKEINNYKNSKEEKIIEENRNNDNKGIKNYDNEKIISDKKNNSNKINNINISKNNNEKILTTEPKINQKYKNNDKNNLHISEYNKKNDRNLENKKENSNNINNIKEEEKKYLKENKIKVKNDDKTELKINEEQQFTNKVVNHPNENANELLNLKKEVYTKKINDKKTIKVENEEKISIGNDFKEVINKNNNDNNNDIINQIKKEEPIKEKTTKKIEHKLVEDKNKNEENKKEKNIKEKNIRKDTKLINKIEKIKTEDNKKIETKMQPMKISNQEIKNQNKIIEKNNISKKVNNTNNLKNDNDNIKNNIDNISNDKTNYKQNDFDAIKINLKNNNTPSKDKNQNNLLHNISPAKSSEDSKSNKINESSEINKNNSLSDSSEKHKEEILLNSDNVPTNPHNDIESSNKNEQSLLVPSDSVTKNNPENLEQNDENEKFEFEEGMLDNIDKQNLLQYSKRLNFLKKIKIKTDEQVEEERNLKEKYDLIILKYLTNLKKKGILNKKSIPYWIRSKEKVNYNFMLSEEGGNGEKTNKKKNNKNSIISNTENKTNGKIDKDKLIYDNSYLFKFKEENKKIQIRQDIIDIINSKPVFKKKNTTKTFLERINEKNENYWNKSKNLESLNSNRNSIFNKRRNKKHDKNKDNQNDSTQKSKVHIKDDDRLTLKHLITSLNEFEEMQLMEKSKHGLTKEDIYQQKLKNFVAKIERMRNTDYNEIISNLDNLFEIDEGDRLANSYKYKSARMSSFMEIIENNFDNVIRPKFNFLPPISFSSQNLSNDENNRMDSGISQKIIQK